MRSLPGHENRRVRTNGPDAGRDARAPTPRKRMQRAAALNEREAGRRGRDQPIAEPELLAQRRCRRASARAAHRGRRRCVKPSTCSLRIDAAGARPALEQHERTAAARAARRRPPARRCRRRRSRRRRHGRLVSSTGSQPPLHEVLRAPDERRRGVQRVRCAGASRRIAAVAAACTSMSNRISVWSHTNPTGTMRKRRVPLATRSAIEFAAGRDRSTAPVSGRRSGRRANNWSMPARAATPAAVAATSVAYGSPCVDHARGEAVGGEHDFLIRLGRARRSVSRQTRRSAADGRETSGPGRGASRWATPGLPRRCTS